MPPQPPSRPGRSLQQVVDDVGIYPEEAYLFIQRGLAYTVDKLHGEPDAETEDTSRHISGQDLCEGLREYALMQWGMLARTVLARWNITSTLDFGRIVFALVDNGYMHKTPEDNIEDFRNVFDFRTTMDATYKIVGKQES